MSTLTDHIKQLPSRREPPYRPALLLNDEERAELAEKLGDADNYDTLMLRDLVQADPENVEFRKAMVSAIASAEFAGVDAFSRKVCEWQDWDVPWSLIMSMARQTWDEVRHAKLATGILDSYDCEIGEYPDTLAGGAPPPSLTGGDNGDTNAAVQNIMGDPVVTLSAVNVSLEGAALVLFKQTSELGAKIGDELMEHCYDYNWADEVTHTMIGDYFIKELCETNPEAEKKALRAHAMFEYQRARLNDDQTQELKEFFAEEMERAQSALGGGYH